MSARLRAFSVAALLAVLVSCGGGDLGEPPAPRDLAALDGEVAARVKAALARVNADRGNAAPRLELGMVYSANGLYESARGALDQAASAGSLGARPWFHLALVRAELGDVDGAIAAMEQAADMDRAYAPIRWQLGFWHLDRGDTDAAQVAFSEALEIDPSDRTALLGLARVHLQRGDPSAAEAILGECDNDPYCKHLLALACSRLGRADEAQRLAAEVAAARGGGRLQLTDPWRDELRQHEGGYEARLGQARDKAQSGDYQGALVILEELRRGGRHTVAVCTNLGMCFMALRRYGEAVRVLEEAVALDPGSLTANNMLAGAYWMGSEGVSGAALDRVHRDVRGCIDRALAIDPAHVPTLGLKGDVLASAGRNEEAIEAYREAARWESANPQWLLQVAVLEGRLRRFDAAAAALRRGLEIAPNHPEALGRLGLACLALGQLDEAEAYLRQSRAAGGAPPDPRLDAALVRIQELRRGGSP